MHTTESTTTAAAFATGARDVAPLLLGVIPFGLVAGVAAVDAGIGVVGAVGFSTILFAGASQLAAIDLLAQQAPAAVAIGTALVINLRMLMYSASLAPHLATVPRRQRVGAAYLLTDQAYAVSILAYRREALGPSARLALYLGAGSSLWVTWQVATIVGALAGGVVPPAVPLGFAVPLAFLSLLVPAMIDRPTVVAGAAGATVATLAVGLPANAGMPLGAASGVLAGWLLARRRARAGATAAAAAPASPTRPGEPS